MGNNRKKSSFVLTIIIVSSMFFLILPIISINIFSVTTKAITAGELEYFAQNDAPFYEPCDGASGGSGKTLDGDITISGKTAEEKTWSGLSSFLQDVPAAGVMGNIAQEDGNHNPVRREVGQSGSLYNKNVQVGLGFVQWSFGRRVNLLNYVKSRDSSLVRYFEDDSNAQLTGDEFIEKVGEDEANKVWQVEIEFLKKEIDKSYKSYYEKTDLDDATVWFRANFERAGTYSDSYRIKKAHEAYGKYAGNSSVSDGAKKVYETKKKDTTNVTGSSTNSNKKRVDIGSFDRKGIVLAKKTIEIGDDNVDVNGDDVDAEELEVGDEGDNEDEDGGVAYDDSEYKGGGEGSGINCGSSEDGGENDGANTNNINETGFSLAWPLGTPESKYKVSKGGKRTKAYAKAVKKLGLKGHGFTNTPDCGCFVTTVVRYSGVDKEFQKCGAGRANLDYAKKHPKKWEVIEWNGDSDKVQAGDVITAWDDSSGAANQHSFIILEKKGKKYRADAHYVAGEWGRVTKLGKKYTSFSHKWILRAKNSVATNGTPKAGGVVVKDNQGNGDIGASAIALAWPEGTPESTYRDRATEKFANYYSALGVNHSGDKCADVGKSCDRFAYTAVRYAGVEGVFSPGNVGNILDDVEKSDQWDEVKMSNVHSTDEYQSGDLILFGHGSRASSHVAIYAVDTKGKGHVVQASYCSEFGIVKDTGGITSNYWATIRVFRNKGNKINGMAQCDSCATEKNSEEGSTGELKAGGMTLAEAKAFVKPYHDAAMGKYYKKNYGDITFKGAAIHDDGCPFGPMNNCVSFSQWFINKYTTAGPKWGHTSNGNGMVNRVSSELGFEKGTEPRPYAIFSKEGPSAAGHTGVILGVDKDRKEVVVGEASCSSGRPKLYYEPRAQTYSFDEIKSWTYAYTDDFLKGAVTSD